MDSPSAPCGTLPAIWVADAGSRAYRTDARRHPEVVRYVARAGLGALPSGVGAILMFGAPQVLGTAFFLWAIWQPPPPNPQGVINAWIVSVLIVTLWSGLLWLLIRRDPGLALGILRAPFIRLTVTDRRILWTLPWWREPLMELDAYRIEGGLLGEEDKRGRGNAVILLVPGDHAGDDNGHIHLDRLPRVAHFVEALRQLV